MKKKHKQGRKTGINDRDREEREMVERERQERGRIEKRGNSKRVIGRKKQSSMNGSHVEQTIT